jgi:hypothetical protein
MKILDNGIVRDMTVEEEAAFLNVPVTDEEAVTRYANSITGADDPDLISAAETLITDRIKEEYK